MAIPEAFIQELKERTDIADVISGYVQLKKSGRSLMGLCPFHNEKTGSFSVSRENGFFHCFGCGAGGDVINFIKRIENLDYVEAVRFLAQKAGMTMPEDGRNDRSAKLKTRIYEANREAARFFYRKLYSPEGKKALDYLRSRGLSEKTIVHFGLGYAPSSRFELVNHLRAKGFTAAEMIQANLANKSSKGNPFDRFCDRVMFPIIDLKTNVIAFGGRIMTDAKPKYLNTSDTPVFNKSRNLFALNFAKNKADGQLILVEGYMDVIALHQAGIENAIATLGTALTQEQSMIIKRHCEEVVICYDADDAGQRATQRAINILRQTGIRIKILTVPDGKDPDEFIKSHGEQGAARFRMLLEKTGNDVDYKLKKLRASYNTDITEQKVEFLTKAAGIIAEIENPVEQNVYMRQLCKELDVDKESMERLVSKISRQEAAKKIRAFRQTAVKQISGGNDKLNRGKVLNLRAANAEEALIALMVLNPDIAGKVAERVDPKLFITDFNRNIYEVLQRKIKNGMDVSMTDISGDFSDDEMSRISSMLISRQQENDAGASADEYIAVLQEESEKLTPEEIAAADNDTIMEQLRKLKEKKS